MTYRLVLSNPLGIILLFAIFILFGVKGNQWAWQNKHYESIDAFHESQKKWAIAGIYIFIFNVILVTALIFVGIAKINDMRGSDMDRAIDRLYDITKKFSEAGNEKCELSSEGIAKCFMNSIGEEFCERNNNVINDVFDNAVLTFYGNGICQKKNDCKVTIQYVFDISKKNIIELPLYVDSDGYIYINKE